MFESCHVHVRDLVKHICPGLNDTRNSMKEVISDVLRVLRPCSFCVILSFGLFLQSAH